MKYWRGYLTAAIFGVISWGLMYLANEYSTLVDMVYPYVTRSVQGFLTAWTAGFDGCVWQLGVLIFVALALAALVLVFVFRGSIIQWLGWVLAGVSLVFCLHTGLYGLNLYAGPIEDDLRLDMVDYTQTELEEAALFYRDMANAIAVQLPRDEQGLAKYSELEDLAQRAGSGFRTLVLERSFSIYGGDYTPVKELGWADLYTSMGVSGFTCAITGEAAVNPQIPAIGQPYAICREMAKRMCVAQPAAAEFSAYLACEASVSREFQYSGYFMAFRHCYEALYAVDPTAATRILGGCVNELVWDMEYYDNFFNEHRDEQNTSRSRTLSGLLDKLRVTDPEQEEHRSSVCDYLVNWYLNQYAEPEVSDSLFDPFDETQVDLSGITDIKPTETESAP